MITSKRNLATLAMILAGSLTASALDFYSDTDNFTSPTSPFGVQLTVGGGAITGTFDIRFGDGDTGDIFGYNPLSQSIIEAVAGFTFRDRNGAASHVSINLDGEDFIVSGAVSRTLTSLGGTVLGNAYMTLDSSGVIGYSLELLDGDPIFLSMAALDADVGERVIGVPETGTTLSLLGVGLLACAGMNRKMRPIRPI